MDACLRGKLPAGLFRVVGAAIILLTLGGCLVSKQPLVTEQGAAFPLAAGTRLEQVGGGKPPVTLQIADGYYEMIKPDGKEVRQFRMQPIGGGAFLLMVYFPKDKFPYGYSLAHIRNDHVEVFYVSKKNLEGYLTRLAATDPGRARSVAPQMKSVGDFFEVNSQAFVEMLLPEMLREGFVTKLADYSILQNHNPVLSARGEAPPARPAATLEATTRRATADLISQLELGKWAREKDGFKSMRVEFYSRAVFGYSVKPDRSACYFHFWREEKTEEMLNRAYDKGCDGTVDAVKRFGDDDWDYRNFSAGDKRFYAYYLPRYAALFRAANGYKSFNPRIGRLALLPDLAAMAENRKLLQRIVNSASGTSLMAVRRKGANRPTPDEVLLKIWVNEGPKGGGFIVYFSAEQDGKHMKNCVLSTEDPKGSEGSVDKNCDGTPEGWKDARGLHSVSAVGNEKVTQSLLLDVARFANVANAMFPPGEIGPSAPPPFDLIGLIDHCRSEASGSSNGFDIRCLVLAALQLSKHFRNPADEARFLIDVGDISTSVDAELALATLKRVPESSRSGEVLQGMVRVLSKAQRFDAALQLAEDIKDPKDRAWSLWVVTSELARSGDFDAAERTASKIEDDGRRFVAFRDILERWLEQNGLTGSERFTKEAVTGHRLAHALALVGAELAKTGAIEAAKQKYREALKAADRVFGTDDQEVPAVHREGVHLYTTVARAQFESGFDQDGLATLEVARSRANTISDPESKAGALTAVAWEYGKLGMIDAALATLDQNAEPVGKVRGAIAVHDDVPEPEMSLAVLDYALKQADKVGYPLDARLEDIALGQARFGAGGAAIQTFKEAVAAAESLNGKAKQEQLRRIAEKSIEAGVLDGAKVLADAIGNPLTRAELLAQIGGAYWKTGEHGAAESLFKMAMEAFAEQKDQSSFAQGFNIEKIVKIQARVGATDLALENFKRLRGHESERSYRFAAETLLKELVTRHDVSAALDLLGAAAGYPVTQGDLLVIFMKHVAEPG